MHPGFDTVVMPRGVLPGLINSVGNVFVGFPPVGGMLAEALSNLDRSCVATRHVHVTFHIGRRNGHWGGNDTWGVNTSTASSGAGPLHQEASSGASVLLDLNQRLAREARDRATGAFAHATTDVSHSHSQVIYRTGRRCKEASSLPTKCYAGHYYPQSTLKFVLS